MEKKCCFFCLKKFIQKKEKTQLEIPIKTQIKSGEKRKR
jgi:hypothetical protein